MGKARYQFINYKGSYLCVQHSFLVHPHQYFIAGDHMPMLDSFTSTPSAVFHYVPQPPVCRWTTRLRRGALDVGRKASGGSFFLSRYTHRQRRRSWRFAAQVRYQTLDLQIQTILKHASEPLFRAKAIDHKPCLCFPNYTLEP